MHISKLLIVSVWLIASLHLCYLACPTAIVRGTGPCREDLRYELQVCVIKTGFLGFLAMCHCLKSITLFSTSQEYCRCEWAWRWTNTQRPHFSVTLNEHQYLRHLTLECTFSSCWALNHLDKEVHFVKSEKTLMLLLNCSQHSSQLNTH